MRGGIEEAQSLGSEEATTDKRGRACGGGGGGKSASVTSSLVSRLVLPFARRAPRSLARRPPDTRVSIRTIHSSVFDLQQRTGHQALQAGCGSFLPFPPSFGPSVLMSDIKGLFAVRRAPSLPPSHPLRRSVCPSVLLPVDLSSRPTGCQFPFQIKTPASQAGRQACPSTNRPKIGRDRRHRAAPAA